ncbi:MAG: hypothetical protein ACOYNO_02810 [Saprospiraceae bacterium]
MMSTLRFLPLCVLLLAMSCQPEEAIPEIVVTAEPEFRADLYESIAPDNGARATGFWLESIAMYPCDGYATLYSTAQTGNGITIDIAGVEPPDECVGNPGRLRAFLALPALIDGEYALTFHLGDALTSTGRLQVDAGRLQWQLEQAQGIDFRNRETLRMPEGLVWGEVRLQSENERPVAQNFIAELKAATSAQALAPGFYSYFTVTGVGTFSFHESFETAAQNEVFVRQFNGPVDAIRLLVEKYRNHQTLPLQIRCFTTFGEI